MRVFNDKDGRRWEVAVAFGSFGEARLIFSRMDGDELRSLALGVDNTRQAERELAHHTEQTLLEQLDKAEAWS